MAKVVDVVCYASIISRKRTRESCKKTGGCDTMVRYLQLAEEELPMNIALLGDLKERGFKTCGMTELFGFLKLLYLAAARKGFGSSNVCLVFSG